MILYFVLGTLYLELCTWNLELCTWNLELCTWNFVLGKGEFNLRVQQWYSFSLQRSEMFIATSAAQRSRSVGAKPGSETSAAQAKAVALLRSEESNKGLPTINISPLMGRRASM